MDFQKNFESTMLGNVSSSSGPSCHECQELVKELELKDKIIQELREKLKNIQEICITDASSLDSVCEHQEGLDPKITKSFNVGNGIPYHSPSLANTYRTPPLSSDSDSSADSGKDNSTSFNLKLVKLENSPTMASIKLEVFDEDHLGSNSNSSFPSFVPPPHHQENRNEVSKITVQEIIDKVIERSPKRDDSLKTRNVENICNSFNTLLSKLESQAERKERNQSEPWNGSSEDQSNSSNEQTFVNRPPPTTATTTTSGSNSCMDLVLHSNSKRNLYSCCPTIPNPTTASTTTTTEFSSLKAKPSNNNNINEASNSSSFGLSDNSSRKRKTFAAASSSEQPSSSSSSSAALFPSSTNSNFHHPPHPAVGHHHHHFVYYPKSIPAFPYYTQHQQQLSNSESNSSKPHFLQCPKCSRSFSTQLILLVHMKDCCQDVNVTPTVTSSPTFNFAVCCSSSSNNGIGGGGGSMTTEILPDQIPKAVLNRIPIGTDISMVYSMHNNSNHTSAIGTTNAKSNHARKY